MSPKWQSSAVEAASECTAEVGLTTMLATWLARRYERLVGVRTACRTVAGGAGPASTSAFNTG